jgi:hypothetical protein
VSTYSSRGGLLVAGLASHLESDAIGSGILELEGGGRQVVEILVEELNREKGHVVSIVALSQKQLRSTARQR